MKIGFERTVIYLITEGKAAKADFSETREQILDIVKLAVECGVSMVQIREKLLTTKLLFSLVSEAAAIASGSKTAILVNDRADVAMSAGADGVHLTANSMPPDEVRAVVGPDMLIGVSTHSEKEVVSAARLGADFVVFGPVFETPGKGEPTGVEELARVCEVLIGFPVIALGGIDASNYQNVIDAGAGGIAAIRFLNNARELAGVSTAMRRLGQ